MDVETVRNGLEQFIREKAPASAVRVTDLSRLSGGASRETWTFDADVEKGSATEHLEAIFRADPGEGMTSPGRQLEYSLIKAAWENGVRAPEPLWDGDIGRFGVNFFTMKRVPGETLGARLVRGDQYAAAREVLPAQLGESLARIHRIDLSRHPELRRLPAPAPGVSPAESQVAEWEATFRLQSRDPHPVFELVLRWLKQRLPPPSVDPILVHGDFRLGNVIFGEEGLRAVIDWELAHFGDPMEDLGWVMCRAWRFGGTKPVAGVGDREPFFAAYEAAGGFPVDPERVRFWEVFANLKWGVITITQAERYLSGVSKSVELATIGRRTADMEQALLDMLEGRG
ncbi:MAG: phosphotransferase family protein [Chloroflexi bacterium]|nr:phosphotransferase family protein [Chloroflexota bacterium]